MSFLLSDSEYEQARARVRAGDFTPELYRFLGRLIAAAQSSRSLAPAPNGGWGQDAIEETLQAWLADSLLEGGLRRAFDRCNTPRAFARYLDRSLRNWLIDRARGQNGPRLLVRTQRLMRDDPAVFYLVQDAEGPMHRWWGLTAWGDQQIGLFAGPERDLVAGAYALGDLEIVRFTDSDRADPVLNTADLTRLVMQVLHTAGAAVSLRMFDHVFRKRFAFAYALEDLRLDDVGELEEPDGTSSAQDIEAAARLVLARLTRRQLEVLRLRRDEHTLDQTAEALGCSRGTVDNEQRRALVMIREAAPTDEDVAAVLETTLQVTSGEVNDDQ